MRERGSRSIPEQESILEDPSNQDLSLSKTAAGDASASPRIHKKFYKPLRIICVIIAVVFAVLILFRYFARPFDKTHSSYYNVTIEEGDDIDAAAAALEEAGIIGSRSIFKTIARLSLQTDIKPGIYYLSPSMDSVSVAREICKGRVTLSGFIIPDGYTLEQTFASLSRDGFGDKDAFLRAAAEPYLQELEFIGTDVSGYQQLEGFLLPGSYSMDIDADETMIIMTMLDSFGNFFNDDYRARTDELGMSIRDVVTIASMIEKETSIDSERAAISSVIHNQLNLGMIAPEDFPEVPLCSPGEASILAALYPEDNEDIYYVLSSKLDGTHVFTQDENEYNDLVAEYEEAKALREEKLARRDSDDQE